MTGTGVAADDDAFAATVAPASQTPVPPIVMPASTRPSPMDAAETHDAPASGALPPLPIVSDAFYKPTRDSRAGHGRIAPPRRSSSAAMRAQGLLSPRASTHLPAQGVGGHRSPAAPGIVPVYESGRWPIASRSSR